MEILERLKSPAAGQREAAGERSASRGANGTERRGRLASPLRTGSRGSAYDRPMPAVPPRGSLG